MMIQKKLFHQFEENYINPVLYCKDSGFKELIFHVYNENDEIKKDFHCTPRFICDFNVRNRFSSRFVHLKKGQILKSIQMVNQ